MLRPVPSVCQAAGEGALGVHARETAEGPDGEDVLVARVADSAGLVEDPRDVLLQEHQCSPRLHWRGAPQTKPGEGGWRGVSVGAQPSAVTHQVPDLGPSPCNPCSLAAGLARAGPGEGVSLACTCGPGLQAQAAGAAGPPGTAGLTPASAPCVGP